MNKLKEAAQRMVDAFAPHADMCRPCTIEWQNLEEALKQEQGEPVGIANVGDDNKWYFLPLVPRSELPGGTKLYAKPQPKRKPLTDEQIVAIVREASNGSAIRREGSTSMRIARAIEAAHGIKE